jgi:hypothetical protein
MSIIRATVTDRYGSTKVADLPVAIEPPDASWLLMAGLINQTQEYFARTRDAGVYSAPVLMVPADIDTLNSFTQEAGQFVKAGGKWFLAGVDTRVEFVVRGTILSSSDLVNWDYFRLGSGGRTNGIAFSGSRLLVSTVFGDCYESDDLGETWSASSRPVSEVKHGVFSQLNGDFIFGAYLDDIVRGPSRSSLTVVDTPLTASTTSDDIPCIAVDKLDDVSAGAYVAIGNRRGEFGYSTDGGVTWLKSDDSVTETTSCHWMDMKCRAGVEFFAAGSATNSSPTFPHVARSFDGGVTWQIVNVTPYTPEGYINLRLFCCVYSDGKYFFGGNVGLESNSSQRRGILLWTTDFENFDVELVLDVYNIAAMTSDGAP